jgi:hypothetical protein
MTKNAPATPSAITVVVDAYLRKGAAPDVSATATPNATIAANDQRIDEPSAGERHG